MKMHFPILVLSVVFSLPLASANVSSSLKTQAKPVVQKTQSKVKSPAKAAVVSSKTEMQEQLKRDKALLIQKKNEMEGKIARPLPSAKEKKMFEELLQAYERNDELSFASRYQAMMSEHPKSIYADETLYLGGMMAIANKQYGKAITLFSKVIKDYPRSGKVRAALFAKGAAYKKMNLQPQAKTVFASVQKVFPGSPEARRAEVELRLIK